MRRPSDFGTAGLRAATSIWSRRLVSAVVFLALTAGIAGGAWRTAPMASAAPSGTQRADAVVLVNSASDGYVQYTDHIKLYLDHFGIPYTPIDISKDPVPADIGDYAVIIIGQNQLDPSGTLLDPTEQGYLSAAVHAGTGLVNFDNNLSADQVNGRYQFVDDIFGFGYGGGTTGNGVDFPDTTHYITQLHSAGSSIATHADMTMPL